MQQTRFGATATGLDHELTDGFAGRCIRRKAQQLVGKCGFTESDHEDIAQHLALKLLERLPAFDPEKSHSNAFVTTIVERCAATFARSNTATKRDTRRDCFLGTIVDYDSDGPIELGELVGQPEDDARRTPST